MLGKRIVFVILFFMLSAGCTGNFSVDEQKLNELFMQQEKITSLVMENNNRISELISKYNPRSDNEPLEPHHLNVVDVLKMPIDQQNEFIKQFVHSGRGGALLADYDLYMVPLLLSIFQVEDTHLRFTPRGQVEIDEKLGSFDAEIFETLPHYISIEFNQPIEILGIKATSLSLYAYQEHLYLSVFQSGKYLQGFSIQPLYYVEMFIKVSSLINELLALQCGSNSDCSG